MSKHKTTKPPATRSLLGTYSVQTKEGTIEIEHHDGELFRRDHPEIDEMVPVDHNTCWGTLGSARLALGFDGLKIIRDRCGPSIHLREIRTWLRQKGIEPGNLNWLDVIDLVRKDQTQEEWSRPCSKSQLADALGLTSVYKLNALAERGLYRLRRVGNNRQQYQICLTGLPAEHRKKLL